MSDKYIYNALNAGCDDDVYYKNCILNMMRAVHEQGLHTHEQCKNFIGKIFRVKFFELPIDATDSEVCDFIIKLVISMLNIHKMISFNP